jgi:hypothetical protein
MAASGLEPRVAVTQAEATDAHVGIRLNRIHSNNQARLNYVATTTDSTTTTTTAAASAGNVYVTAAVFANNGFVAAAPAAINDDSTVERERVTQPLSLSSSTLPGLRGFPQPVVHTHRWARSR